MMKNIDKIKQTVDSYDATLVVATKNHTSDELKLLFDHDVRNFGENKVQEFLTKYDDLKDEANWQFIGTLQTNKVKYIIDKVSLIQSAANPALIEEISKRAKKADLTMDILLEMNISKEESKHGFYEEELEQAIHQALTSENIRLSGFMTMAPDTEDEALIRDVFKRARQIFDRYKVLNERFESCDIRYMSMGMSQDYKIALDEGANMVRLGRIVFE